MTEEPPRYLFMKLLIIMQLFPIMAQLRHQSWGGQDNTGRTRSWMKPQPSSLLELPSAACRPWHCQPLHLLLLCCPVLDTPAACVASTLQVCWLCVAGHRPPSISMRSDSPQRGQEPPRFPQAAVWL